MGEICHPSVVSHIYICCAVKGLKTNHDYLVESMESKSPKEIQVEEKITELVTKIVDDQTFPHSQNSVESCQEPVRVICRSWWRRNETIHVITDSIL